MFCKFHFTISSIIYILKVNLSVCNCYYTSTEFQFKDTGNNVLIKSPLVFLWQLFPFMPVRRVTFTAKLIPTFFSCETFSSIPFGTIQRSIYRAILSSTLYHYRRYSRNIDIACNTFPAIR